MSPYVNRELTVGTREELEAHFLVCESCQSELELFRRMVLGMQALPLPRPPTDFSARVMAGWRERRDDPELAASAAASTALPTEVGQEDAATKPPAPSWMPPPSVAQRKASQVRSFYATAAMVAVVFLGGLLFGSSWKPAAVDSSGMSPNTVAASFLPVSLNFQGNQGKAGTWNQGKLQMQPAGPVHERLHDALVALQVPAGVKVQFTRSSPDVSFQPSLEPATLPSQIVSLPCAVGQWEREITWMAERHGRFHAWVEVRSRENDGIYRRVPIELIVIP